MGVEERNPGDLKMRVSSCLSKLSDRDTCPMAANELENIARSLRKESFGLFLRCLSSTDSSEKSPVHRHRVRLLTVMSSAHGDALSSHVPQMISVVLRRLRDGDSAVRAACVDAVSSIAAHVKIPPFSVILKPLVDALIHEQDANAQLAAALCLSAVVEASPEPDTVELKKLLPKILKLAKSDSFKAKPALLCFITGIVNAGCLKTPGLFSSVVSTAVEFLTCEEWAVRKAAAELLEKAAVTSEISSPEQKTLCVTALQNRKFDKVKLVRETMNRALEKWRDVPSELEEDPSSPEVNRRNSAQISSPPSSCSSSNSTITTENATNSFSDVNNPSPRSKKNPNHQDFKELSLVREHLLQIENQQYALLHLLQNFIGRSQKSMNSLGKRVDGLEKALHEISRDPRVSGRRITHVTCCQGEKF